MIRFDSVFKSFEQKLAVDNVSFTIPDGQITGLLGPNGAGKTTLIRMLNKIISPDKGAVFYNDEILTQKHLSKIGYLPEERGLYKMMTVWNHVKLLGQLRGMTVEDIESNYRLWEEKFGMEGWRKKRIEELSKGMAQKVQFVCAVIHQPEVLILDEPFSGFDPVNIELIAKEIKRMRNEGKTILLSSHNMKSVEELCDKVVMIHDAKKVIEGSIDEVRTNSGEELYAIKFRGSSIALANALWVNFELAKTEEVNKDVFIAYIKLRNESTFDDLLKTLIGEIQIEAAWKVLTSMQEVFIQQVTEK